MPLLMESWILLIITFLIGVVIGRFIWKRD